MSHYALVGHSCPKVTTYKGRDIRELSREELIEALEWATSAYHEAIQRGIRNVEMMRLIIAATSAA